MKTSDGSNLLRTVILTLLLFDIPIHLPDEEPTIKSCGKAVLVTSRDLDGFSDEW